MTDERGMTLVETVLALLVLSVGLLAVAGMTLSSGTQARRAGMYTDQTLLAQEELGEVVAEGWAGASPGTTSETARRNGTTWVVTTEVTQVSDRLREVTVTVGGVEQVPDRTFTVAVSKPRKLPD